MELVDRPGMGCSPALVSACATRCSTFFHGANHRYNRSPSIFIFLITLLLVASLPDASFPDPRDPAIPSPIPAPPAWLRGQSLFAIQARSAASAFAPSGAKLLVQRWATFLGVTGTILAAGQYIPQIVYTARTKLVGSLSIPMMCLQVPGSIAFVYAVSR